MCGRGPVATKLCVLRVANTGGCKHTEHPERHPCVMEVITEQLDFSIILEFSSSSTRREPRNVFPPATRTGSPRMPPMPPNVHCAALARMRIWIVQSAVCCIALFARNGSVAPRAHVQPSRDAPARQCDRPTASCRALCMFAIIILNRITWSRPYETDRQCAMHRDFAECTHAREPPRKRSFSSAGGRRHSVPSHSERARACGSPTTATPCIQ